MWKQTVKQDWIKDGTKIQCSSLCVQIRGNAMLYLRWKMIMAIFSEILKLFSTSSIKLFSKVIIPMLVIRV